MCLIQSLPLFSIYTAEDSFWKCYSLSRVQRFGDPMDYSLLVSLSVEFSRQEYWSGLPFPSLRDLSDPEIEPESSASPALAGGFFTTKPPGKSSPK